MPVCFNQDNRNQGPPTEGVCLWWSPLLPNGEGKLPGGPLSCFHCTHLRQCCCSQVKHPEVCNGGWVEAATAHQDCGSSRRSHIAVARQLINTQSLRCGICSTHSMQVVSRRMSIRRRDSPKTGDFHKGGLTCHGLPSCKTCRCRSSSSCTLQGSAACVPAGSRSKVVEFLRPPIQRKRAM